MTKLKPNSTCLKNTFLDHIEVNHNDVIEYYQIEEYEMYTENSKKSILSSLFGKMFFLIRKLHRFRQNEKRYSKRLYVKLLRIHLLHWNG